MVRASSVHAAWIPAIHAGMAAQVNGFEAGAWERANVKEELQANWNQAAKGEEIDKIEPLH